MRSCIILIIILCSVQNCRAQCPEEKQQTFWHPNQLDSFKTLYPDCEKYDFQFIIVDGEYIKPTYGATKEKIQYLLCLTFVLALVLCLLKLITVKIEYFK